jgi:hypothetical protein
MIHKTLALWALFAVAGGAVFAAGEPVPPPRAEAPKPAAATKPALSITPGKVIVPTDAMHRIWGELISVDLATRTGKFRKESTDEVMDFTVLPYAELLHHAAFGDLDDFRVGERAIFRMHANDAGQWVWLTYIQDEMNMMNGHKEYFHVDAIAADKGQLTCTQANADKSYVRAKDILIQTDADTRYWKAGQPAHFADIHVGDQLRTQTHGVGKGAARVCWEVFLDDASLLKFQDAQKAAHAKRMAQEGAPGYVDALAGVALELTLFQEGGEIARALKPHQTVRVAPAGADRKPTAAPVGGTIAAAKMQGNLCKVTVTLDKPSSDFHAGDVARLWPTP